MKTDPSSGTQPLANRAGDGRFRDRMRRPTWSPAMFERPLLAEDFGSGWEDDLAELRISDEHR